MQTYPHITELTHFTERMTGFFHISHVISEVGIEREGKHFIHFGWRSDGLTQTLVPLQAHFIGGKRASVMMKR